MSEREDALEDEAGLVDALLAWYAAAGRDLPWRRTREPYRVWLSEVMLQQTQVTAVLGYYERFLAAYPTLADLAAAPLDDVLRLWEGLGYYARCRNLHAAAQRIVADHGGAFPGDFEAILALPGVGRSTAGAISTFAFGAPRPLLDGNVRRLLARLYAIDGEVARAATQKRLWAASQALVDLVADDPDRAYALNQALMELGATHCGRRARCDACPLTGWCRAHATDRQAELPRPRRRKARPHVVVGLGIVARADGAVLIQRRPEEGLLGGLWEFPGGKREGDEPLPETVRRELAEELAIDVAVEHLVAEVDHAYSHFSVTLHAYRCRLVAGTPQARAATQLRWVTPAQLADHAFPRANRRIIDALLAEDAPLPPLFRAAEGD